MESSKQAHCDLILWVHRELDKFPQNELTMTNARWAFFDFHVSSQCVSSELKFFTGLFMVLPLSPDQYFIPKSFVTGASHDVSLGRWLVAQWRCELTPFSQRAHLNYLMVGSFWGHSVNSQGTHKMSSNCELPRELSVSLQLSQGAHC